MSPKCDFCLADLQPPVHTYLTPSTGTLEEARRGEAFWAEDPRWAACAPCHETIEAVASDEITMEQGIIGIARRAAIHKTIVVIGPDSAALQEKMRDDQMKHIVGVIKAFFVNRSPGFTTDSP